MRNLKFLSMFFLSLLFLSCSGKSDKDLFDEASKLLKEKKYSEAVVIFDQIAKEFPESENAINALFENAKIYQGQIIKSVDPKESLRKSVEIYKSIFEKYPDSDKAASAIFMSGFILANELQDYEAARKSYELYLSKFPNGELADDAKVELANLGKTPEEILKDKINQ